MSEPLDMEHVGVDLARQLMAEVERLRAELARQAEQITAVRALHVPFDVTMRGGLLVQCCESCSDTKQDYVRWPCPTIAALDGTS